MRSHRGSTVMTAGNTVPDRATIFTMVGVRRLADRPAAAAGAGALLVTLIATATVAGLAGAWDRAARTLLPSPFGPLWFHVLVAAVALGCTAVTWLSLPTPGAPIGLALVVAGWLIPFWSAWAALPEPVRAACLAASPLVVVGNAVCVLAWRPSSTQQRRPVLLAITAPALLAVVLHAAGYDPFADPQCRLICTHVTPMLDDVLSTRQTLVVAGALTLVCALAAAPAMATARAAPGIVRLGAELALVPLAAGAVWPGVPGSVVAGGTLILVAAIAVATARSWRVRRGLRRLVDSLTAADASPGPNLPVTGGVHFAVGGSWIDGRGQDVIADGASWLVLTDEAGAPSIRLAVARPSDRDAWLAALTPASRLALTNARLAAVVHARVREVAASQRRIVVAADGERRRIERDLHDGAQQQLVSIALHLSAVRNRLQREPASELAAELNAALDSVNVALAGLRRLAHGIFPPALGDEDSPPHWRTL